MTSDWLYPLSSSSDYYFIRKNRQKTADTGPASFEQMINDGAKDDVWGVQKNWKNLKADDRIWVYYGTADGDLGVVGRGQVVKIKEPKKPGARADVTIHWDIPGTKKLLKTPFPAKEIRKYIPRPQGTVWAIEPKLASRLQKHVDAKIQSSAQSVFKGKYAMGVVSSISYELHKNVKAHRRHDSILRTLHIRLSANGWQDVEIKSDSKQVDLAVKKGSTTIIIEAKSFSKNSSAATREAFAQLAEYSWRHTRNSRKKISKPVLWALFESEPKKDEIEFLEDHSILVSWISFKNRRIIHSKKTSINPIVRGLG